MLYRYYACLYAAIENDEAGSPGQRLHVCTYVHTRGTTEEIRFVLSLLISCTDSNDYSNFIRIELVWHQLFYSICQK
jgi:hypothetical protein